ncbi:MAG: dihydropyrimidinase [Clostridia bacterium]
MRILIQNGTVVTAKQAKRSDVLVENDKIAAIGSNLPNNADKTIDAMGAYVFPGFIDTHTHFDLDLGVTVTADNFITGTKAAILGGTTTVLDFATQDKGMTMQNALDLWHTKAQGSSCNYGFHMAVSEWNPARVAEIDKMIAQGVTSFKMYMVYDTMRVDDGSIYSALKLTAARDCIVGVHCENFDVLNERIRELKAAGMLAPPAHPLARPNSVEAEGIARLMRIAELANAPAWVVHLSTKEGLEEARRARERGQEVYLETCPQYLILDDARYTDRDGEKFIMSPPLRKPADQTALFNAMQHDEIDVVGTDHCSFTMVQKALGKGDFSKVPNGGAGVQNRIQLIYTYGVAAGYITPSQMAAQCSENAARLFGMYPQKGTVAVGSDADLVIYEPSGESHISYRTNAHNCDNSPYENVPVKGSVRHVLLHGTQVVENGQLTQPGCGQYVFRSASLRPRR